jgi:hypothetical protein
MGFRYMDHAWLAQLSLRVESAQQHESGEKDAAAGKPAVAAVQVLKLRQSEPWRLQYLCQCSVRGVLMLRHACATRLL